MNRSLTSALLAITLTLGCGGVALSGQALADIPPQPSSEKDKLAVPVVGKPHGTPQSLWTLLAAIFPGASLPSRAGGWGWAGQ